jgi:paraquat-inducible protein B
MSKQASRTMIGAFVLGAVALVVLAVMIFGSDMLFEKSREFVMFFQGSVSGLQVGAPVMFKGVKLGAVTDIVMQFNPGDMSVMIPVYVKLDPDKVIIPKELVPTGKERAEFVLEPLIDKGLKARLELQSFVTGQLMVGLDFYPDKPIKLVGTEPRYPEIPTIASPLEELTQNLQNLKIEELFKTLTGVAEGINKLVNAPELRESIVTLSRTLKSVDRLAGNLDTRLGPLTEGVTNASEAARSAFKQADKTLAGMEGINKVLNAPELKDSVVSLDRTLKSLDRLAVDLEARVGPLAASIEGASGAARSAFAQAEKTLKLEEGAPGQLAAGIKDTLAAARLTLGETQKAVEGLNRIAAQNANVGYEVSRTLEEISALSRSLRALADYLERHPEALIKGKTPTGGH